MDTITRLNALRDQVAQAERLRIQAETQKAAAVERLAEIDAKITALGVTPEDAERVLTNLEASLASELTALEVALKGEITAYQAILPGK